MKPKVIIGSANLHRAQRFEHKDPAPHLPFAEQVPPKSVLRFYGVGAAILTSVLVIVVSYLAH